MTDSKFHENSARDYLKKREIKNEAEQEEKRRVLLQKTIEILLSELGNKDVEVWLIGSLIYPKRFQDRSDVDIVIKNWGGDRFELWTLLEAKIGRDIEIILYEECHFQEEIETKGLKIL